MQLQIYPKASKYQDLETIYTQCSGPGGLKLAEFMAEKMGLKPKKQLLDVPIPVDLAPLVTAGEGA